MGAPETPLDVGTYDDALFFAKMAEDAERYKEMGLFLKYAFQLRPDITTEQRLQLSVAYSNQIGTFRASWRTLRSTEEKEMRSDNPRSADRLRVIVAQRVKVEEEMAATCMEVVTFIDWLLPHVTGIVPHIQLLKMRGDFYRYYAEFCPVSPKDGNVLQKAYDAYASVLQFCLSRADVPLSQWLGIVLTYSVFLYEVYKDPQGAYTLAGRAVQQYGKQFSKNTGITHNSETKDCIVILGLVRDNLTLWTTEWDANFKLAIQKIP